MQVDFRLSNSRNVIIIFFVFLLILNSVWMIHYQGIGFWETILDSFIILSSLYAIALFLDSQSNMYFLTSNNFLSVFIQNIVISYIWTQLCALGLKYLIHDPVYTMFWQSTFFVRWIIGWLVLTFLCFYNFMSAKINEQREIIQLNRDTNDLRKEAELFKLRQQIQPHFLFNSLNSINALVKIDPNQSRDMIQKLSLLLRHTLKKDEDKLVSLPQEIEDLELYLSIEQVRFGDRLQVIKNIKEDTSDNLMPPFLIQPLVENAIKFGLYGTLGSVEINVDIHEDEDYTYFKIKNPFDDDAAQVRGTGFGLKSIKRRLYLLYARNDLLQIHQEQDGDGQKYFIVSMQIPHQLNFKS